MALRLTTARFAASSQRIVRTAPSRALSAVPNERESYNDRMKKTGRPVSPHVTVYAFPTVAISSVTVRITGCLLSIGLGGVAGTALVGGVSPSPTPRPPPAAPLAAPQGSDVRQREEETERVTGAADVRLYELCADPLLWLGTSRRRLPDSD